MTEQEILSELCRNNDSLSYYAYCLIKQLREEIEDQQATIDSLVDEALFLKERDHLNE